MKKRNLLFILSEYMGLVLLIIIFIAATGKLKSENATLTFHLEKYKDKVNSLEEQIEEYQKIQNELNSQNVELQNSLNEANDWNRKVEIQLAKNITANEDQEKHYGNYQGNDDFSDIINDNPIDKDYWIEYYKLQESENTTTLAWGALEGKYTTIWEKEVNAALSYLYKTLNEQDSNNLKQAQISWQKSINDDEIFVSEKFIITGFFGSQGFVQIGTVRLHRTRERAIELMEFIFSIDRSAVDFVYDN